ncbi:MAG: hypothetical protein AAF184_23325 [Pseudomonadota bacterium]
MASIATHAGADALARETSRALHDSDRSLVDNLASIYRITLGQQLGPEHGRVK